jgi:hypothetical protein
LVLSRREAGGCAAWVKEDASWAVAQKCYQKALLEMEREMGDVLMTSAQLSCALVRAAVLHAADEPFGPQCTSKAVPAALAAAGTHHPGRGAKGKGKGVGANACGNGGRDGRGGRGGRGHVECVLHLPSRSHAALAATLD